MSAVADATIVATTSATGIDSKGVPPHLFRGSIDADKLFYVQRNRAFNSQVTAAARCELRRKGQGIDPLGDSYLAFLAVTVGEPCVLNVSFSVATASTTAVVSITR